MGLFTRRYYDDYRGGSVSGLWVTLFTCLCTLLVIVLIGAVIKSNSFELGGFVDWLREGLSGFFAWCSELIG